VSPVHSDLEVVTATADECLDLRRRVLRTGTPSDDPRFEEDADPATFHLGVRRNGRLICVGTFTPSPAPGRPGRSALRLRGMATEPADQGCGAGRMLLAAAAERGRAAGFDLMWAKARDSALCFYEKAGLHAEGDSFVTADTGLPHHVVIREI
jgi:GNAT superfamily N-acetyltransferase